MQGIPATRSLKQEPRWGLGCGSPRVGSGGGGGIGFGVVIFTGGIYGIGVG